jgi:hypothetical protein
MCSNDSRLHTIKPNLPGRLLESYAPLALPFQREYFGEPPSKFIGRLNRIVRCRQYESLADREPYREAMGRPPDGKAIGVLCLKQPRSPAWKTRS